MEGVIWKGSPNHYSGRHGYQVTHITLHIMVGYLAGTDSTFANQSSQASAHYGIGATGEIHQYVSEANGSYSDANYASNCSTISIEHEGGMADGAVCTQACIDASARLCADIARRYGWEHLWHDGLKGNVWLHREIPGTDHACCPDLAPNGLPFQQVIDKANAILNGKTTNQERKENMAEMLFNNTDNGKVYYWNILTGCKYIGVSDQLEILKAAGVPMHETSSKGSWMTRAQEITDTTLAAINATINAQAAAIETLSKSIGADPGQIAEAVKKAVADKLDSLHITIKAED
jgi:N-acetylmuramoyl-L-alanine amidase|nr:MAG TPA: N-acetylmuramoyl-L-alanine amidase [Caudoviricetes sp.]